MFVVVHFVYYRNQGTDFDHTSHVLINSFLAISIKFRRMKGEKNLRWKQRYSKVCIIARLAFRKIFVLHETLFEIGFSKFKLFETFRNSNWKIKKRRGAVQNFTVVVCSNQSPIAQTRPQSGWLRSDWALVKASGGGLENFMVAAAYDQRRPCLVQRTDRYYTQGC